MMIFEPGRQKYNLLGRKLYAATLSRHGQRRFSRRMRQSHRHTGAGIRRALGAARGENRQMNNKKTWRRDEYERQAREIGAALLRDERGRKWATEEQIRRAFAIQFKSIDQARQFFRRSK